MHKLDCNAHAIIRKELFPRRRARHGVTLTSDGSISDSGGPGSWIELRAESAVRRARFIFRSVRIDTSNTTPYTLLSAHAS